MPSQHYAFHVSDAEFDAILRRVKDAGLTFGSGPWSLEDGKLNDWNGGRGFYYKDHDGHVIELMTVPQSAAGVVRRSLSLSDVGADPAVKTRTRGGHQATVRRVRNGGRGAAASRPSL